MLTRSQLKRRTPLKRGKGLKRSSALPRKRSKPRRGRVRDEAHLAFVRTLPCCAPGCDRVDASEAHHETTERGMGQKADDRRAMPMCRKHHRAFHDGREPFDGWTKPRRRAWQDEQVTRVLGLAAPCGACGFLRESGDPLCICEEVRDG